MKNALRCASSFVALLFVAAACSASGDPNRFSGGAGGTGGSPSSASSGAATSSSSMGGSILDDGGTGPCGAEPPTKITGTVYAPNATDPLYGVSVYVPGSQVEPFADGVECIQCSEVSGDPIVYTTTDTKGQFTLDQAPCGMDVPLVLQIGKWRMQLTLPEVKCCAENVFDDPNKMRLPKNQAEGDLPRMAIVTGQVDNLECAFRKMGIDDSEFTVPTAQGGTGRVQFYLGDGAPGAIIEGAPIEDQLWGTPESLAHYDLVFLPCQGAVYPRTTLAQQNMIDFANKGGRVFATHYSYVWIHENEWNASGDWSMVDPGFGPPDLDGIVNTSFPEGKALADWLFNIQASTQYGKIPVQDVRKDISVINPATTKAWIHADPAVSPDTIVHLTFDTPLGADRRMQCGRVLFDDFHVEEADLDFAQVFPFECKPGPMTAQEKLLEFMIFDLSTCVGPPVPPK